MLTFIPAPTSAVQAQSFTPKFMTMPDFKQWSWNSPSFPGADGGPARQTDFVADEAGDWAFHFQYPNLRQAGLQGIHARRVAGPASGPVAA